MNKLEQFLCGETPPKLKRKSPEQKRAYEAYQRAERNEDRYLGSVFANSHGQRAHQQKTHDAYEQCKKLGMTHEHGL